MNSVTTKSVGDLATLNPLFEQSLRAADKVPQDHRHLRRGAGQLLAFLQESGMPTQVTTIGRVHVESFIERLLATKTPAANLWYRALTPCSTSVGCNRSATGAP